MNFSLLHIHYSIKYIISGRLKTIKHNKPDTAENQNCVQFFNLILSQRHKMHSDLKYNQTYKLSYNNRRGNFFRVAW